MGQNNIDFDVRLYNPNGFWVLQTMNNPEIRYCILQGGSSSSKSYSLAQIILFQTIIDGANTLVLRKVGASIRKTIYKDFEENAKKYMVNGKPVFRCITNCIKCYNGAVIDFSGLDDDEKIKGISSYKRIFMDELTEYEERDFRQIRTRMRGIEGQQLYGAFNPISESHWIKKKVFDKEKWHEIPNNVSLFGTDIRPELTQVKEVLMNEPKTILNPRTGEVEHLPSNFLWLKSTYLNNFWVVGSPDGTYGYYDVQCIANYEADKKNDPDYYRVYALGEWGVIRTGGEALPSFSMKKVSKKPYNPELPVHVSVDNNVLPYITSTLWQYDIENKDFYQFAEVCAEDPENTASRAGELVAEYLDSLGADKVYLHGDVTTKAASTIDDEKRSFFDKYMEKLSKFEVEDCTPKSNPSVRASLEFANSLFDGWNGITLTVDESCQHSIEDYLSVKKDTNGGLLKVRIKDTVTKQSYEEHGHCCFTPDTLVATTRGLIPISCVKIGDSVVCENAESIVYNSFKTCKNAIFFVSLINGRVNNLSYNHPIKTDRGFVPAYKLKIGDVVTTLDGSRVWKEKLRHITALGLFVIQIQNVIAIGNILKAGLKKTESTERHPCTDTCGSVNVAQFLMASMFITLMVTATIIHLITLPLLMVQSMKDIMASMQARSKMKQERKLYVTILERLLHGTRAKKAESGTQRTGEKLWLIEKARSLNVRFAKRLTALFGMIRGFVLLHVEPNGEECPEQTMRLELARFVALNLWSIGSLVQSIVLNRAPLRIGGISDLYDISTDCHTFFANGVLVHNCDTMRYVICDVLKDEYAAYSLRRKHNKHTGLNYIEKYEAEKHYTFIVPSFDSKASVMVVAKVGDRYVVESAIIADSLTADQIIPMVKGEPVFESEKPFFDLGRELRKTFPALAIRSPKVDADERIKATLPLMDSVFFMNKETEDYLTFLDSLQDYNGKDNRHASNIIAMALQYFARH